MASVNKMENVADFIRKNFNIVKNSVLALILLGLEKLMDLEFTCPANQILAVIYSLVIFLVPTIIVAIVACRFTPGRICCKCSCSKKIPEVSQEMSHGTCKRYLQFLKLVGQRLQKSWAFFPLVWVMIMITDGRYLNCLIKSAVEIAQMSKSNSSYPVLSLESDFLIQIIQMIGLVLFLGTIILVFCKKWDSIQDYESKEEISLEKQENILLEITENMLREQAKERQNEFIREQLRQETWRAFNPGHHEAQRVLEKMVAEWKEKIKESFNKR